MYERKNDEDMTLSVSSPIEFVLTGPADGRDTILVKSSNAKLDLVGLAIGNDYFIDKPDLLSTFFNSSRQLNKVVGLSIADRDSDYDKRRSSITFAWTGFTSTHGIKIVEKTFKMQSYDIGQAIDRRSQIDLEIALSPVVLSCSQMNDRRLRFRRMIAATTIVYVVLGLIGALFTIFAVFAKKYGM